MQPISGISDSNNGSPQASLIRLQVAALLEDQSVNEEAQRLKIEPAFKKLKQMLEALPSQEPIFASEFKKIFRGRSTICPPFPNVRPAEDAKHRYGFAAPTEVEIVGSFALQTLVRDENASCVDVAVVMPKHLLEAKDYLNHRYTHKKAFYLACIAHGLLSGSGNTYDLAFAYQDGNEFQPCLLITALPEPREKNRRRSVFRILVGPPASLFRPEKLRPWMDCLRESTVAHAEPHIQNARSSPLYNGSVASDRLFSSYYALQKETAIKFPAFQDACKLGRVWLRQRGLASNLASGGFGSFEFGAVLALSLQRKHNLKLTTPTQESDSYQLFRSLIQVLAFSNWVNEPAVLGNITDHVSFDSKQGIPLAYDTEREHNILFKMTTCSYELLKMEAQVTFTTLTRSDLNQFYPTFIARLGADIVRFDHVWDGSVSLRPGAVLQQIDHLHRILKMALRDRVLLVDIQTHRSILAEEWSCDTLRRQHNPKLKLRIRVLIDPVQVARRVDLGPSAEDTGAAESYRNFWGEVADLRRFANGEIRESVTWSAPRNDTDILNSIIEHVVAKHFSADAITLSSSVDDDFMSMLHPRVPTSQALSAFSTAEEAFAKLQDSLRSVSGHPLRLRKISASAPGLRYASIEPERSMTSKHLQPLDVVIQFEGTVRWPEDIVAIQHTKGALLSKIAEQLDEDSQISGITVGLENAESNFDNRTFLDLVIGGISFRIRIHHDGEVSLLANLTKDKSWNAKDRNMISSAISEYKRKFVDGPRHTQAIREFCTRTPLSLMAMRIFKLWISSHLLLPHFCDELLELLAVHVFASPSPYASPGSLRTAFIRILLFLSRWEWQSEPVIVNLATSPLARSDVDNIMNNFQAWRKLDPGMQRVVLVVASNINPNGDTWTTQRPGIVAVNRLTSLARAAWAQVVEHESTLQVPPLFVCSLNEFDFVIRLNRSAFQQDQLPVSNGGRLTKEAAARDGIALEYLSFINELERIFHGCIAFFHNNGRLPIVAGVWVPRDNKHAMKLGSSWLTEPAKEVSDLQANLSPNKPELLHQIASLGGDLISSIAVTSNT